MSLNIKDKETDALVRELAQKTGRSITEAVRDAVTVKLNSLKPVHDATMVRDLLAIGERLRQYPVVDDRPLEEMLYDENGLPA